MRRSSTQEAGTIEKIPRRSHSPWFKGMGVSDGGQPAAGEVVSPPEHSTSESMTDIAPILQQETREQPKAKREIGIIMGLLFLAGVGVTAWGITIVRSDQIFTLPFLTPEIKEAMKGFISNYPAAIVGGMLALVGALFVGFIGRKILPDKLADLSLPLPKLRRDMPAISAFVLAVVCEVLLCWHLTTSQYTHWDIALFFAGILLLGFTIYRLDTPGQTSTFRVTRLDAVIMLGLGTFAGIVSSIDLTRWNFAWIGDEGAFFGTAHFILTGNGQWNFFKLNVVYDQFPMMDSVYQALVMKMFGDNIFGWRFSEVLVMVGCTMLVYLLGVALFGRFAGISAAVILASSHYLMAFTHIAYNNTHMVFYSTLAILMLVLAWRTQRAIFVYGTGVSMGLCLYTIQGAYLIWPTIALLLLVVFLRRPTWRYLFAGILMLLGFAIVITPGLLTTSISELIRAALFLSHREVSAVDPLLVARVAFVQSSVAFWNDKLVSDHYVAGALVDFVTGVLLFAGIVIACLRLNKRAERILLVWFLLGLVMVTVSTYVPRPPLTRLLYLLPPVALLAGMALYKFSLILRTSRKVPAPLVTVMVASLLAVIPVLNLNQLLVDSPTKLQLSPFGLVMKAIQEHPTQTIIEVGAEPAANNNLLGMIGWYPWYEGHYKYINVSDLTRSISQESQDNPPIFMVDQRNDAILPRVTAVLAPDYRATKEPDLGHTYVWLFKHTSTTSNKSP